MHAEKPEMASVRMFQSDSETRTEASVRATARAFASSTTVSTCSSCSAASQIDHEEEQRDAWMKGSSCCQTAELTRQDDEAALAGRPRSRTSSACATKPASTKRVRSSNAREIPPACSTPALLQLQRSLPGLGETSAALEAAAQHLPPEGGTKRDEEEVAPEATAGASRTTLSLMLAPVLRYTLSWYSWPSICPCAILI